MMTILTWLKRFFFGGSDQSSRSGRALNGQTQCATATVPQDVPTLTECSQAERDSFWKNKPHTSAGEQMQEWERHMDSWISRLHADPATREQYAFLQRLLGGDKNGQAHAPVVVSAQALYNTFFTGEGNGDSEYFFQRIVRTNTAEQIHRHQELIGNLAKMYGAETATRVLPLLSALRNTQDPHRFSLCIGTDIRTGQEVGMTPKALEQHVSLVGNSGTGKTTLCLQMLNQLFRLGHGGALVEPHGDLTRQVIACLPEESLERVVYLDLSDGQSHFGLNLYQCDAPHDMTEVAKVASFVMHVFEQVWNVGTETPRLQQVLRNITRTLLENPGMTFAEIPLLLWEETAREKLVTPVKNTQTQLFWQQYNKKSVRDREELIASTINKVDAYLNEPLVANIVSQSQTTLDFRHIMDEGKILLVNLSPQLEEMSRLIGAMLVGKLLMAAFSRADTPEQDRRPFYIFIDEFQRFCSAEFRTFIEEARKFHVSVITAHQSLTQLEEEHRTASTGAGSLMCFRVLGDPDAKVFARSFDATPQPVEVGLEPQRAVSADPLSHLVSRGHQDSRVARFAQTVLHNLEYYLKTPSSPAVAYVKEWQAAYYNGVDGTLILYDQHLQQGRKLLNACLYRCMSEANPNLSIPMLAIYILAAAQRDGREYVFSPHIKHYNHGFFFGPFSLETFEASARKFGEAWFVEPQRSARYIASVAKYAKKEQWMAEAVVSMLTELRYVISALAQSPILIDTGHMVAKYQLRTYQDQQNENANELSQLQNYHAKVKILTREHLIQTMPPPAMPPEHEVQTRIAAIKARMLAEGYTHDFREVAEEIAKRHELLRQRPHSDAPPPSSSTGRPPRRLRHKPPSSFT